MNHTKYIELVDRTERSILNTKDLTIHEMAIAVVEALLPELDAPDGKAAAMAQSARDLVLSDYGEQIQELRQLLIKAAGDGETLAKMVSRLTGMQEVLNALQLRLTQRVTALEGPAHRGPPLSDLASNEICRACHAPRILCRCPTL